MSGAVARAAALDVRKTLSRRVVNLYRRMCREVIPVRTMYQIDETPGEVRHMVLLQFRQRQDVTDPRMIDTLIAKGEMELQEARQQWKQRGHLMALLKPDLVAADPLIGAYSPRRISPEASMPQSKRHGRCLGLQRGAAFDAPRTHRSNGETGPIRRLLRLRRCITSRSPFVWPRADVTKKATNHPANQLPNPARAPSHPLSLRRFGRVLQALPRWHAGRGCDLAGPQEVRAERRPQDACCAACSVRGGAKGAGCIGGAGRKS